jgi:hypothetical protein
VTVGGSLVNGKAQEQAMNVWRILAGAALAVMSVWAVGCNPESLPGLGRVTGTVTMDGKPVPNASLVFTPKESGATASLGRTDDTGNYELYYSRGNKGAKTGEHSVTINNYRAPGEDGNPGQPESIPTQYNLKTELTATVNSGTNKIDFALKGGGEVVQPDEDAPGKKKARSVTGCF